MVFMIFLLQSVAYGKPFLFMKLNIVEGKMQYLYDETGRRYLDAFAGIVTVSCGHCHPDVVNAIIDQTKLLQHATTIYLHHAIADYAEELASKMPGNLKVAFDSYLILAISFVTLYLHFSVFSSMRDFPAQLLQLLSFLNLIMQVVYFVNSGSEANELAMLMARLYTGNLEMISLRNAYHGGSANTLGLTALNTWKYHIPQVPLIIAELKC